MNLRLAIVEDDRSVLEGLAILINGTPGLKCVGAYRTAQVALPAIRAQPPDVALIDLGLPGQSGEELIRALRPQLPQVKLLVLTQHENADRIFRALQAGADGYLLKKDPPTKLLEAIHEIAAGHAPMSSEVAVKVVEFFHQDGRHPPTPDSAALTGLAPRERQVLELLAKGFTYKEIADQLGLTFHTVNGYVKSLYEKLHVRSRAQAVNKLVGR